jgi:hypothetical protein
MFKKKREEINVRHGNKLSCLSLKLKQFIIDGGEKLNEMKIKPKNWGVEGEAGGDALSSILIFSCYA